MKTILLICAALGVLTGCAAYTLVPAGSQTVQGMTVQSQSEWSKASHKPTSKTEVWTKDGQALNDLRFIGGVEDGESIFKQPNKELPMPTYSSDMLPNEIVEMVETSIKNSFGGEISIETANLRPQMVNGNTGFRFELSYFTTSGLAKSSDVIAIPKDGRLNLVIFTAATMHYHGKEADEINNMFGSIGI